MSQRPDTFRDLLFGLLALQTGMINQTQIVAAFQAWTLAKRLSRRGKRGHHEWL